MQRIAIFGGTFNPPHNGHIAMLNELAGKKLFSKILVIPTNLPPHKSSKVASGKERLSMCEFAFKNIAGVEVCDLEIRLGGKSYTFKTLEALKKMGITDPALIIGADSLINFTKWKHYDDILKSARLFVYGRNGYTYSSCVKEAESLKRQGGRVELLDFLPPDISSTEVRRAVLQNEPIKNLVPRSVEEYIIKNGLYKEGYLMEPEFNEKCAVYRKKYQNYVDILRPMLTEKRFFHSLCVAKEAERLAEKYGSDEEKAFLCGLLHDICKDMDKIKQLQLFEQFGIILSEIEKNAPKLWHAILGSAYLKNVLNIRDNDILFAVRYHTTARAGMSLSEKILYLADFTSQDRDYSGVLKMREAVNKDLDTAMYEALKFTVEDLKQKGSPVHPDTLAAFEEYKK